MTPGAQVAAAIEILQDIADGQAAEQALTRWGRRSRFAGSKDRAAIRDHVFDVLRRKRSAAHLGGGDSPRALMIGMLRGKGADLPSLFSGEGHAPAPLTAEEHIQPEPTTDTGTLWNLPDWLVPQFKDALTDHAEKAALALQDRAPIILRVNSRQGDRADAMARLAQEGITTVPNPLSETALTVTEGARRIRNSDTYKGGVVELQDASSQAVVDSLPPGRRVLDYCAGGGGKALALAADPNRSVFASDVDPNRMRDLPDRAKRARAEIEVLTQDALGAHAPFDVILCDVPCSGSGAWRRSPEGKWTLTPERLEALQLAQDSILDKASKILKKNGILAMSTCSILKGENEDRVTAFLNRHNGWHCTFQRRFDVTEHGDGFFTAHLKRD